MIFAIVFGFILGFVANFRKELIMLAVLLCPLFLLFLGGLFSLMLFLLFFMIGYAASAHISR
jgi:hypothetical protein